MRRPPTEGSVSQATCRRLVWSCAAGLLILSLVLSACAPSVGPVGAPTAAPKQAPQPTSQVKPSVVDYKAEIERLHEAAKKEGTLGLYSSMNLDDAKVVLPEFEKAFPGVKVDHTRATSEVLQQRLISEVKGGKVLADVLDTNAGQYYPVLEAGFMEAYPIPAAQDLPLELRDENGL